MDKPIHVMIDIETLSTDPDAAIISIGAVRFDPDSMSISDDTFYYVVDPYISGHLSGSLDASTVLWWLQQTPEAQEIFRDPAKTPLDQSLDDLNAWLLAMCAPDMRRLVLWANGAYFDFPILRSAYARMEIEPVWKYTAQRCFATVRKLIPLAEHEKVEPTVAHNALEDARAQALELVLIMRKLPV